MKRLAYLLTVIAGNIELLALETPDMESLDTLQDAKTASARGAQLIGIGADASSDSERSAIKTPACAEILTPFVDAVVLQLLAYQAAVAKGTDVDQPRNLAKSVTVE